MDPPDSSKRLKSSSGAPISRRIASNAANLPAYQPPPPISRSNAPRSSASIARPANNKTSLRLTVKAPPSKLRQATSGSQISLPNDSYADTPSESDATPAPAPRTARSTRNPRTVVDPDSEDEDEDMMEVEEEERDEGDEENEEEEEDEEEDEEDEEDEEEEEDAPGEEEEDEDAEGEFDTEIMANEDSEEDAEGEDEDMEDHPPPPIIRQERVPGKAKPNVIVTAPHEGTLSSVEDKEMENDDDDDDDEELSELESNEDEDEDARGGEVGGGGGGRRGRGNDDEEEDGEDEDEEDDNSRSATPDIAKLTKRQRGQFEEDEIHLMSLSNEAQKKKHLTAEEHAMRRAEMARRRKNLSEKRNEEEKLDTINKLLKKPAPKRRTRAEIEAAKAAERSPGDEDDLPKPDGLFLRWVHNRHGSRIGVTDEWLDAPIGEPLLRSNPSTTTTRPAAAASLVQEVA